MAGVFILVLHVGLSETLMTLLFHFLVNMNDIFFMVLENNI